MTYLPHVLDYQQLPLGGPTGKYDCTAWMAAWLTDAHTSGATKITGRQVRLASNEPVPDPDSPGLNLGQVDTATRKLTGGKVDLDTRIGIATDVAQRMVVGGCAEALLGFDVPARHVNRARLVLRETAPPGGGAYEAAPLAAAWTVEGVMAGALPVARAGPLAEGATALEGTDEHPAIVLDVTDMAAGWTDGTVAYHGLVLRDAQPDDVPGYAVNRLFTFRDADLLVE